jgi:hypothetical protein
MANYGVQKSSLSAVLSWYNNQDDAAFRIFRGNKENDAYFCDGYTGSDREEGEMALAKALSEIEPTDYNVYFLKLYPSNPKAKKSAPGITFQLHSQTIGAVYQQPGQYQAMNEILSEIRALRQERMAEVISEDEEEEEIEAPATPSSILAGILQTPQVQSVLINVLTSMAGNLMSKSTPVKAVAGVEPDEISKSIEVLLSKGVTPDDLARLAAMDQGQINFLLSMLRK